MSTITELYEQGHRALRLPYWAAGSHIRLEEVTMFDGVVVLGPWVHVWSGEMRTEPPVLLVDAERHVDWEPYVPIEVTTT